MAMKRGAFAPRSFFPQRLPGPAFDFVFWGCPVLGPLKGGAFDLVSLMKSRHRIDADQRRFPLRVEAKPNAPPLKSVKDGAPNTTGPLTRR
jgi:hypothetical protein